MPGISKNKTEKESMRQKRINQTDKKGRKGGIEGVECMGFKIICMCTYIQLIVPGKKNFKK